MKTYKSNIETYSIVKEKSDFKKVRIINSQTAYEYCLQFWNSDIEVYESMFLLLLNRANNTIGYVKISQGGICGTVADVKIIMKYALESFASGAILCHNHPSGNLQPSDCDIKYTKKIKEALNYMDTKLLEHLIISESGYYSMADEGIIF